MTPSKKKEVKGYVCMLAGVFYSPVFFERSEAVKYSYRPKGTEVKAVTITYEL